MATLRNRLARIEDRLLARRETEDSMPLVRREYTNEEIIEISLILLAYVYKGDTEAYAPGLVRDYSFEPEKATELAEFFGTLLAERRAVAPDPRRPV
jgi:hypothetical protein